MSMDIRSFIKKSSTADLRSKIREINKTQPNENNIDYFTKEIILFQNDEKFEEFESERLYKYLMKYKKEAQLALNNHRNNDYYRGCYLNENTIQGTRTTSFKEDIEIYISRYLIVFYILNNKEYKKLICKVCDTELPRDSVFCLICKTNLKDGDKPVVKTGGSDGTICMYCDGEIVDGKCTICDDSLFKTGRAEKDDTFKKYKSADTIDRMIDEDKRKGLNQQNKNTTEENIQSAEESYSNYQTNIKKNKEGIRESIEVKEFFDTNSNKRFFTSFVKETVSDSGDKSYHSLDEAGRSSHKYNRNRDVRINENVTNYDVNEGNDISQSKTLRGTSSKSNENNSVNHNNKNYSEQKGSSNSQLSTNRRNENWENKLKEINIEEKRSSKPESTSSVEDDCNKKVQNNQKSFIKSLEQSSHWICNNCTFRNTDLNSLNCEVCETNRSSNNEINDSEYSKNDKISNNVKNKEHEKRNENNVDQQNIPDTLRDDKSRDKSKEVSSDWKCDKCSYLNKDLCSVKCSICDELRFSNEINENEVNKILKTESSPRNIKPDNSWICKGCTFVNNISNKICEVCMTINESVGDGRDLELPEETWICKRCKISNSFDRYKCSNCKELADFFNKWVCEMCRFFNDKSAIKCGACENKNPNVVKCSQCKEKCVFKNEKCIDCLQKNQLSPIPSVNYQKEKDKVEFKRSELPNDQNKIKQSKSARSFSIDVTKDKRCINFIYCKGKLTITDHYWCKKCEDSRWFCPNEDCGTINYLNKYCKKCKLEKDSDVSNCRNVTVLKDNKPAQMWMCGFCKKYTAATIHKCSNCKNNRDGMGNKKCHCGWNNKPFRDKCENCDKIIKKVKK